MLIELDSHLLYRAESVVFPGYLAFTFKVPLMIGLICIEDLRSPVFILRSVSDDFIILSVSSLI
jgi:hypothetical protein